MPQLNAAQCAILFDSVGHGVDTLGCTHNHGHAHLYRIILGCNATPGYEVVGRGNLIKPDESQPLAVYNRIFVAIADVAYYFSSLYSMSMPYAHQRSIGNGRKREGVTAWLKFHVAGTEHAPISKLMLVAAMVIYGLNCASGITSAIDGVGP